MVVAANWMLGNADEQDRQAPSEQMDSSDPGSRSDPTGLSVDLLFERVLDAVVIARLSTGRIVAWNPAAEKLFGYTAKQAVGQPIEILMPEAISHLHRAGLERYMRTGHGLIVDADSPVEMPARTRDDEQIRIEMKLSELRNARGERFALAVVRDAMHRKRLELTNLELVQARVARSEAESELELRDKLLEALTNRVSALTDVQEDAVASDQLKGLADALEDFQRLRSGELSFRPVDGELVDVVHAAVDAARRRAPGRKLLVYMAPSVPATFDPARTRQLLTYLLDEVIGTTPPGARIELHLDQPTPQIAELRLRLPTAAPGVGFQIARALAVSQKGSLTLSGRAGGELELVLMLPGRPHPARRKPGRSRPRRERSSVP